MILSYENSYHTTNNLSITSFFVKEKLKSTWKYSHSKLDCFSLRRLRAMIKTNILTIDNGYWNTHHKKNIIIWIDFRIIFSKNIKCVLRHFRSFLQDFHDLEYANYDIQCNVVLVIFGTSQSFQSKKDNSWKMTITIQKKIWEEAEETKYSWKNASGEQKFHTIFFSVMTEKLITFIILITKNFGLIL